eukprot:gene3541-4044_t
MSMLCEYQRREAELVKILENKDMEIQDYKDQGILPSRKHIETSRFDAKAFKKNSVTTKVIADASEKPLSAFISSESINLYGEILKQSSISRQEYLLESIQGHDLTETYPTQPIMEHVEETLCLSHATHASKSSKSFQDDELKRRGLIEKRLAEQKLRDESKQKKSRKIKNL